MTSPDKSLNKIQNTQVARYFAEEIPFRNFSGTMWAEKKPQTILRGDLNEREIARLRIEIDTSGIRFVVFSYGTPIAWRNNANWTYIVEQDFGPATEQHKRLLQ